MIKNVLAEFNAAPLAAGKERCAILGFREHIFSSSLGSCGDLAASHEAVFGTLVQRVMFRPLSARQHYGHPDFMDKLRMIGQGGVSKAVRGLHLSEDIFSGFCTQLGGGRVVHRERGPAWCTRGARRAGFLGTARWARAGTWTSTASCPSTRNWPRATRSSC